MLNISEIDKPESSSNTFKVLLFIYSIIITCLRNTEILAHPRFWAEEGKVYFNYAFEHNFLNAVIAPHIDYYSFVPNLATCIATLSVEKAPLITTIFALICQLIPIWVVVFGNFIFWNSPLRKVVTVLLIITIAEPEIWLNTINSQFFLALTTILIFFEAGFGNEKFKWSYGIILLLAGLTGPVSAFVLPVFIIKYFINRDRTFVKYTLILLVPAILQVVLFLYLHLFKSGSPERFGAYDLDMMMEGFFAQFFSLIKVISINDKKHVGIIVFIYFIYIVISSIKNKDEIMKYLIIVFVVVSSLSLLGAANMKPGPRYAYIPTFLLCMIIYSDVFIRERSIPVFRKYFSLATVVLTFTSYIFFYRYDRSHEFEGPAWKTEVEKWKTNSSLPLKIYPLEWEMYLENPKQSK